MQPTQLSPYRDRTAELERLAKRSAERKKKRSERQNRRDVEEQQQKDTVQLAEPTEQPIFSGEALQSHVRRQEQARQQNAPRDIHREHPNELPLTDTQFKAKTTHIERQKLARKLRHDAEQLKIGSEPSMDNATGPYWSKDARASENRSMPPEQPHSVDAVDDTEDSVGVDDEMHASVFNHTNNDSYSVRPEKVVDYNVPENVSENALTSAIKGSPTDSNKLSASDLGTPTESYALHSALETDIFSINGGDRESKGNDAQISLRVDVGRRGDATGSSAQRQSNMQTSSFRGSEQLDASEMFDITSPYHPRYKDNISTLLDESASFSQTTTKVVLPGSSSKGEKVLTGLHGAGLSKSASNSVSNPADAAEVAVATAKSSNWARIFNGSGTKQRVAQKIREGKEAARRVAPRVIRQREVIKSLSSQHIDAVNHQTIAGCYAQP
eukprot:g3253.t1